MIGIFAKAPRLSSLVYQGLNYASFDCDNCHKSLKNPECKACHRMVNYFKVFEIPQQYKVDTSTISERAKTLQKQFHPDKNNERNEEMQKIVQYSAYINDAKSTLLDDLKRAVYMMQLKGVKIEEQTNIEDEGFMMDMFELQEEIESAKSQKQIIDIKKRIQNVLDEVKKELSVFFASEDLEQCKIFVFKYKYLHRALENVKAKLP